MKIKLNFTPLLGFIIGIIISSFLVLLFKENPAQVLKVLSGSFLQSKFDFGLTLFYTTCFIFSGLAFSIPFRTGLFHIGTEGQLVISAMVASVLGQYNYGSDFVGIIIIICGTLLSGFITSILISWFKVYKESHEVVVAIMLNFIWTALASFVALKFFQNPDSQNPESALIKANFQFLKLDPIKIYFDNSAVSSFLIIAIFCCFVIWFFETKTKWGWQLNAFGQNPSAAERMGISKKKMYFISFGLAGFFSALIGLTEVLGSSFQYKVGFSPAYGFLGIVVALLAQGHPIGMIFSSFVLAVLHKGASDLDLETQFLTRDFSKVLQSLIIFCVASATYINFRRQHSKGSKWN